MSATQTFVDRVRDLFLARPNEWISAVEFERVGGRQAWRTRISDVRRTYGLRIENRVRTVIGEDGLYKVWRLSEYRYVRRATTWIESADQSPDQVAARVEGRLF